jgi:hypothetical protein
MTDHIETALGHLRLAQLLREYDDMSDPDVRSKYVGHLGAARGTIVATINAHERAEEYRADWAEADDE